MKKLLPLFLVLLCFSENAISATRKRSTRRTSSASKTVTYTTPTQDQCNIDIDYCFSRYCFDKKTLNEGVYSKCGAEPASTILVNVEDCLATRAVIKQLDLQNGCKTYSYNRIVSLLNSKGTIETGLKKNSTECAKATRALQAAKKCYTAMISSDGSSSVELYDELDSLCGFEASGDSYMLNRFYQAGDYGDSNVGALEDLRLTGQNTQKRENWRQVVDATLAGYTEMAELACGAEDYKLTKVNEYDLDSHSNSQMIALEAEAKAIGEQSADKVVNQWFRESDCVNSPLPVGGLYWSYKKGGNPDCRIVCKEGYFVGRNSSTCVKAQDDKQETFIGLNIGNNWIGEKKVVDEEPITTPTPTPAPTPTPTPTPAPKPTPVVDTCPKLSVAKTSWSPKSKGKDGVCDIFFPRRGDGTCEHKYYCRHTGSDGEWFNIGDAKGKYTRWYDMKLSNDNGMDLNSIFGTKHLRFGDEYSEYLSKEIKDYCLNVRGCKGEAPKKEEVDKCANKEATDSVKRWGSWVEAWNACAPAECQSGYKLCDERRHCCKEDTKTENETVEKIDYCTSVGSLSNSIGSASEQSEWLGFVHKYNGASCDISDVAYLTHHYTEFLWGGKDTVKAFKNCVCKKNDTYEKIVNKWCKKVFPDRNANHDDLKLVFCEKYIAPAYCPESLTSAKWESCLKLLLDSSTDRLTKCSYERYFDGNCLWSSNYDCSAYPKRCKPVTRKTLFDDYTPYNSYQESNYGNTYSYDGYVIPKFTIKQSLPFRDFGDRQNPWIK
ncbi:MAG: hypothetical protein IKP65_03965 [Alphaproteobacteria bacterium]|nr:hypothetical protein [Alphaproteobacteria bacterium]